MRTALRTRIATAALAAALLTPAAGSAQAAQAAQAAVNGPASTAPAAPAAPGAPTPPAPPADRYAGEPVAIGAGMVAVLRNEAEGPEAWIRFVGPDWQPGDTYMVRVLAKLDRDHPTETVNGLHLSLTASDTATPVLTVTAHGTTSSYPLPRNAHPGAQGPRPEPHPGRPARPPSTPATP
ncbi:hypothetical protein [Streptomyces antimicrobicus]|uniref:Secreted protein n=1 Tax=Streptomyces antimicrobicus TaxID=2883108 RepID=A0ABS8B1M8_9ACTN|nr:hypothetical protein [Streptomyces antimicrobicus]MCB5178513.1 hypothetical protein [Streptomyces antimicrobicus]